jgi:hypothetical protein
MDDRVTSRRRLRRILASQGARGDAALATASSFRTWAAKLSQPSVLLLVRDDHIIVQEDGELLASGVLGGSSAAPRR